MQNLNLSSGDMNRNDAAKSSDAKPADKPRRKGMPKLVFPQGFILAGQPHDDPAQTSFDEQMIVLAARIRRALLSSNEGISYVGLEDDSRGRICLSIEAERTDGNLDPLFVTLPVINDDVYNAD